MVLVPRLRVDRELGAVAAGRQVAAEALVDKLALDLRAHLAVLALAVAVALVDLRRAVVLVGAPDVVPAARKARAVGRDGRRLAKVADGVVGRVPELFSLAGRRWAGPRTKT